MKKIVSIVLVMIFMLSFVGCKCEHTYTDATCTLPQTCTKCGETSGEPLKHSYISATCTSPKKCRRCGETVGTSLAHKWSEATCTSLKQCSRCSKTEGTLKAHNYVDGYCTMCYEQDPNCLDTTNNKILTIEQVNHKINSAGGVKVDIKFTNRSNKQIAYIYFTIKFYDRMGKPAYCEIKNTHTQRLKYTGPLKGATSKTAYWDPLIYNFATAAIKPLSAEIEYTDGTKQTITFNGWYWSSSSYYGGDLRD